MSKIFQMTLVKRTFEANFLSPCLKSADIWRILHYSGTIPDLKLDFYDKNNVQIN